MKNSILIVDDLAKNIQIVANLLKPFDYRILFAQNGVKALKIIDEETVDLVLLDVMMPEIDGFEVCKRIKSMPGKKDIPIIFLTAKTDIDSITTGFQLGGVDYVTKPFNNEELMARIHTHLSLRSSYKTIADQNVELTELNAVKDKFFSIIAHDLRNPFNALLVLTEILKTRYGEMESSEAQQMIDMLYDSTKEGYELLDNLLTWSRSQRNRLEFNPVLLDIRDIIQGNVQLLTNLARSKEIQLQVNVDREYQVMSDQNMIDTVIRNLVTNAIKFTPTGGLITISVITNEDEIIVTVKDTGVGISPENLSKLFKIDSGHSTLGTSNEKGTGLGLVLCKEFIDKHEGRIWVESELNKGSEFKFSLPAVKELIVS
ncbi:MAG: hybrid sensor histidine kinase/response regulator [Bacteroidales bacterium]|nr:hybrid sensor histidine kinase/response regulator [Bacteroidales bacterium]